jgi:hypothetical protein
MKAPHNTLPSSTALEGAVCASFQQEKSRKSNKKPDTAAIGPPTHCGQVSKERELSALQESSTVRTVKKNLLLEILSTLSHIFNVGVESS